MLQLLYKNQAVYGYSSQTLEEKSVAADLFYDLAFTAQWRKNWMVIFNASKTKLANVYHRQPGHRTFTSRDERKFSHREGRVH